MRKTFLMLILSSLCSVQARAQGNASTTGNNAFSGNNTHTGTETFTGPLNLNCKNFESIRCVDSTNSAGWAGTTPDAWLASAAADCPSAGCVINAVGLSPTATFTASYTFPTTKPVVINFGAATITGPASGSMFIFPAGSSGSGIIGIGQTSNNSQNGYKAITLFKANAANTSDMISVNGGGATNGIQGLRLENFQLDGSSSAVNCMTLDTMQNSSVNWIDVENCTAKGFNAIVTNTTANSGTQFNSFAHLRGKGNPQFFWSGSNAAKTADFTANHLEDLEFGFGVGASSTPGIELNGADGNFFYSVKGFRNSGTGYVLQFDSTGGSNFGGLDNMFVGFYGMSTNNVSAQASSGPNCIYGYDLSNAEPIPTIAVGAQFTWIPNAPFPLGAGVTTGLMMPNNLGIGWHNNTNGGPDPVLKMDASNNIQFISQETGNYVFFTNGNIIPQNAGGINLGSGAQPMGNLFLGTAATNNFKFQPGATSAARTISILDPGAATTLDLTSNTDTTTSHVLHASATAGMGTYSAIATGDLPTAIPIGNIGSAGLSATAPIRIAATGVIDCAGAAQCVTSAAALTNNSPVLGAAGQASKTATFLTTDGAAVLTVGVAGGGNGGVALAGNTSGVATLTAPAVAGTATNPATFSNSLQLPSGTVYNINGDVGLSRDAAGIVDIGNGTAGNASAFERTGNTVAVTSNFTTASTSLVTVTGLSWTFPATNHNYRFFCHLSYSQATANATNAFGIQATTTAPTNLYAAMEVNLNLTTAPVNATLPILATTTATNIGTFLPTAFGPIGTVADIFTAKIWGFLEQGAGATTLNIMALTGNVADSLTIYRGSSCSLGP